MKKVTMALLAVILACGLVPSIGLAEENEEFESGGVSQEAASEEIVLESAAIEASDIGTEAEISIEAAQPQTRSKTEIRRYYNANHYNIFETSSFITQPSTKSPYALGALSDQSMSNSLNALNFVRYIAGIDSNVTTRADYNTKAQAASVVMAATETFSHVIEDSKKPADMDTGMFNTAKVGAQNSNLSIAYPSTNLAARIINGFMPDTTDVNIKNVGHRRWCLDSRMTETGFGQATASTGKYINYDFTAMYSMNGYETGGPALYTNVAWPARLMPVELFGVTHPWSISVDKSDFISGAPGVSVKLVRDKDGKTWNFSSATDNNTPNGDRFYVDADMGTITGDAGAIIFRPGNLGTIAVGDTFTVTITGVTGLTDYKVDFFSLNSPSISEASVTGVDAVYDHTGSPIMPVPTLVYDGETLVEGTDYTITYSDNTAVGRASIVITGIGSFSGEYNYHFVIVDPASTSKTMYTYGGSHRYETAHAVVRAALSHKTHNKGVIVASGEFNKYADTLSASGLAGALGYPIVLTNGSAQTLSQEARSNILQIADGGKLDVIIVGGEPTVSQGIERELLTYDGDSTVTRLAGNDRYETCMRIYNYGKGLNLWNDDYAIFTTGDSFADALGIAGFASSTSAPIFLVSRNATALSPEMAGAISTYKNALVLGDEAAVKGSVYDQINGVITNIERLGGSHRYETAAKVVEWQIGKGISLDNCGIATGDNFADALGSGFLLSRTDSILALVSPTASTNQAMLDTLASKSADIKSIHVFGSSAAVSDDTRKSITDALSWSSYLTFDMIS